MKPNKTTIAAMLALWVGLTTLPLVAQNTPQVGVIDVRRLVTDSKEGKEVLAMLQELSDQKTANLKVMAEGLESLRTRISEGRLSLSEDRLSQMEKEFEDNRIALSRARDDAEREMQELQVDRFGEIERKVMPIINQVGVELGYTLIFNKFESGLVFAREGADITDMILQRFDSGFDTEADDSVEEDG